MPDATTRLFVFRLDEVLYGLHLEGVERVLSAVEITPLPRAPDVIRGVVNVGGQITTAVDIRSRLHLPAREMEVTDQIILARTPRRPLAILVDRVAGLIERPMQEIARAESVVPGVEHVEGIAKLDDGLVLIHDLDKFLSLDEERVLEEALFSLGTREDPL